MLLKYSSAAVDAGATECTWSVDKIHVFVYTRIQK